MDKNIKSVDEQLNEFVEKILAKINLNSLDEEVVKQAKIDLFNRVEDRINAALVDNIPPEKLLQFEQVLEKNNNEATVDFCKENIPNLEEVIAKELVSFEDIYLKK